MNVLRIAVLLGGTSAEREISLKTGGAVLKALRRLGHRPFPFDPARRSLARLPARRPDFAFICLHGPGGEDGRVQAFLEAAHIPYSGSGPTASALAMCKPAAKHCFAAAGLRTPEGRVLLNGDIRPPFRPPFVVKPAAQGSALGVTIVRRPGEFPSARRKAAAFGREILVERYIPGREITVGILGEDPLPAVEIRSRTPSGFYDYEAKYRPGGSLHLCPAPISAAASRAVARAAILAHRALGCRVISRVDMILDRSGRPWVLEVNTIPGMTATSLLPEAARAAGYSFDEMVEKILRESMRTPPPSK